jgi:hypothetical protein
MPLPNLIPSPFVNTPFSGLLEGQTASFYQLDARGNPVGVVNIRGVPDAGKTSLDMIDSESSGQSYAVTSNAMQDLSSADSNNHRELATMDIVGTLVSAASFGIVGSLDIGNLPGLSGILRKDLSVLRDLHLLADRREPIMAVTPRRVFPRAWITFLGDNWTPDLGENTSVSISLQEARIVNSLSMSNLLPDVAAMSAGSIIDTPMGSQGGRSINTQAFIRPPAQGAAPIVQAV